VAALTGTGCTPVRHVEHVMGTAVSFDVRDPAAGTAGVACAVAWLREVDATFSTYRADSEVSRLGRGEIALADCGADVRYVLALCEELRVASGGAFDCRAGGTLDPSGVVKGWSVDRAVALLGADNACVNAGGDVRALGSPEPGRGWAVGVVNPFDRQTLVDVVEVRDGAVATSAAYERGGHILDPRTGAPAAALASVTVVAADLTHADAYATAAYVLGADARDWLAALPGVEALVVDSDGEVWHSPGLPLRAR
jgi:thiamine biosynthesis lipoprotein